MSSEASAQVTKTNPRPSSQVKQTKYPELRGYLKKKSRQDRWQKRWFEANDHYLTYYKTENSDKLLACIDLYQTGPIEMRPNQNGDHFGEFSIALGDRFYIIKSESTDDAQRWVDGLKLRQLPPENSTQIKDNTAMVVADQNTQSAHTDTQSLASENQQDDPSSYKAGSAGQSGVGQMGVEKAGQAAQSGGCKCCVIS